jgi:CubicO group peptidase (beta-lactamase class C family)
MVMTDIFGTCDPAFKRVRDVFTATFTAAEPYRNVGASLCVYVRGACVLSLFGGSTPAGTPWMGDTLVNIWSATKGVTAIAVAILVDEGRLSYTDKVAKHWPEFAANGKQDITVAQLLSHQAGLNGFDEPTTVDDFSNWTVVTSRLAAQKPAWPPGEKTSYHATTYGFLAGELVRRIAGKSIGTFVAERIATGLQADVFIGVPAAERSRISRIIAPKAARPLADNMDPLARRAVVNPQLAAELPNNDRWIAAEMPALNGHASAVGLAKLYGAVANDGRLGPVQLLSRKGVVRMREPLSTRPDVMLGPRTWAAGVVLNSEGNYGPNKLTFGHTGWGGSFGCGDLDRGLGIGYVHNQMGPDVTGDPRGISLCRAIYECL